VIEGPSQEGGHWVWRARLGDVEVRFTGRGPDGERADVLRRIEAGAPPVAWAKQIHSAIVLPAQAGRCGEGDAVYGDAPDLALSVITADCVPVLLAGPDGQLAAVHAGWRGLVGGVIAETLKVTGGGPGWTVWIGPTIGPCCYEVGEDVAEQVRAASGPEAVVPGPGTKPHLDLAAAARRQLADAGVTEVHSVPVCTRCDEERLYSYRREGKGAGRNVAFIWR
jgi:polyphenol oxidase